MRIAVVGAGISGNLAARLLDLRHEVHVFEAAEHLGGHAQTVDVEAYRRPVTADVAFMVFNRRTYPNFCRLLELLDVPCLASDMSLSIRCLQSGLEYQGSSLGGLFAQRKNLLNRSFYRMLRDIIRFNAYGSRATDMANSDLSLEEFLCRHHLGEEFRKHYLLPMSAAIWSTNPQSLLKCPAYFVLGFLRNHGLLQLRDRPNWMTVAGRSRRYVNELLNPLKHRLQLGCPVRKVRRLPEVIELTFADGGTACFDHIVLAAHADQSLELLSDANAAEGEILGCFTYASNRALLHTDTSVLPRNKRAWASWNCQVTDDESSQVMVSYDLNRLQHLGLPGPLCLTLNPQSDINPELVLGSFDFQHPVFTATACHAQSRLHEINGRRDTSFCGAYWGFGFHEDGVNSALAVSRKFGLGLEDVVPGAQMRAGGPGNTTRLADRS